MVNGISTIGLFSILHVVMFFVNQIFTGYVFLNWIFLLK